MRKALIFTLVLTFIFLAVPMVSAQGLTENLTSYYELEESSGSTAVDEQGNFDGTYQGNLPTNVTGIIDYAQDFDGTGDYIGLPDSIAAVTDDSSYAISAWINLDTLSQDGGIVSFLDGGNVYMTYRQTQGEVRIRHDIDGGDNILFTDGISSTGTWYHVVATYNKSSTTLKIYLNGNESASDGSASGSTGDNGGTDGTAIGFDSFAEFDGQIDEVAIYNKSLNSNQVSELYNNGDALRPFAFNVDLISPSNDTVFTDNSQDFITNINNRPNDDIINATTNVWYDNGTLFDSGTEIINDNSTDIQTNITISNIELGDFKWNTEVFFENDTGGTESSIADANFTFQRGYEFNSETHDNETVELSSTDFVLNVTLPSGLSSSQGRLIYNGTELNADKETSNGNTIFTREVVAPEVTSPTNISWSWKLLLDEGNGNVEFNVTSGIQTVNNLDVDDCSSFTNVLLNMTFKDEQSQEFLNATANNVTIKTDLVFENEDGDTTSFSKLYENTNPAQVCVGDGVLNSSLTIDMLTSYTADDYVTEFYNIQEATLSSDQYPQNINLFGLLATESQEFLITFKDENFLPVDDALIDIQRKYISEGTTKTVEIPKTDDRGQTIGHLELTDVIYTFIVSKDGEILGTFEDKQAVCENQATGDCRINLNRFSSSPNLDNFEERQNVSYTFEFDEDTRTATVDFTTTDGSSVAATLNSTVFDNYGNETVCSVDLVTSSGTLNCVIPESQGNVTIISEFFVDGKFIDSKIFSTTPDPADIFGGTRIIFLLMMYLMIPLMMISSGVGIVIGAIAGLILAGLFNLYDGGTLIGAGSTILWFVIGGGILIWKITRQRGV